MEVVDSTEVVTAATTFAVTRCPCGVSSARNTLSRLNAVVALVVVPSFVDVGTAARTIAVTIRNASGEARHDNKYCVARGGGRSRSPGSSCSRISRVADCSATVASSNTSTKRLIERPSCIATGPALYSA